MTSAAATASSTVAPGKENRPQGFAPVASKWKGHDVTPGLAAAPAPQVCVVKMFAAHALPLVDLSRGPALPVISYPPSSPSPTAAADIAAFQFTPSPPPILAPSPLLSPSPSPSPAPVLFSPAPSPVQRRSHTDLCRAIIGEDEREALASIWDLSCDELNRKNREGLTPFHLAIYPPQPTVLYALKLRGVDPNVPSDKGFTALDIVTVAMAEACDNQNHQLAAQLKEHEDFLIELGASARNLPAFIPDRVMTPAIDVQEEPIAADLFDAIHKNDESRAIHLIWELPLFEINAPNERGYAAIHEATLKKMTAVLYALKTVHADLDLLIRGECSALDLTVQGQASAAAGKNFKAQFQWKKLEGFLLALGATRRMLSPVRKSPMSTIHE